MPEDAIGGPPRSFYVISVFLVWYSRDAKAKGWIS